MKLPVINPRFVVAITLLMLLLSACQKDDSLEIAAPDLSNSMTVTPVSLADLENKPVFNALLLKTALKMDLYKPDDVLEKDGVDYTILTSRISKASFMDYEAYTFLVDNPQQPPFSFDNYIIRKHHDGTVAEFILRYVYDMTLWLGQGEKKFSSISRYDTDYNLVATTDASKNTATALQNNCVVSITVYHQTPDDGIYEWQPGAVCQHTTEGDMCKITIEYTLDCIGGGGGEDNPGGDGPGAGGWEVLPDNGGMGSPISTMEPPLGPEEGAGDLFYLRQVIEAEVTPATTEEELLNKNNALAVYINQLNPFIFNELSLLFVSVNSDSELSKEDRVFLWERARAMYDILKTKEDTATDHISQEAFLNTLSPQEQEDFTTNLVTTALLPAVKGVLGIQWPQNTEEWMALFNLMKPMLIEIGIEFLPLGGLYNAIDDVADGLSEGDYTLAGIGLAGVVMEFIPWGKLIKIGKGLFSIGKKAFKIFKLAYNFLGQIGDAVATGLKTVLDGNTVKLLDNNLDEVARISDNFVNFKYTNYGGDIVCDPDKTTTVIGKFVDNVDGGGINLIKNSGLYKYGENVGGINILDLPNGTWTEQSNLEWLNDAIQRGDVIRVVSDPFDDLNIYTLDGFGNPTANLSPFGLEINRLNLASYTFNPITFEYLP